MAEYLRWGVLGAANFARTQMAPAIHAARGGVLAALATSDPAKAAGFTAVAPELRVHDSYDALLADPQIDAIYIPLPNTMHVEWTRRAVEAGKHVLCEKPIAMTASEIDDLIALRDGSGKLVAEAWMIAHHPQFAKARELLQEDALGKLVRVDSTHSFYNADPGNIRNQAAAGGGALPDVGIYAFGSVRLITGQDPQQILAAHLDWEGGVDTAAHVMARFPDFLYTGRVSTRAAPWQEILLHGERGVMRLSVPFNVNVFGPATLELFGPGLETRTWRWPGDNHYVLQVEAFNAAALGQADFPLPLEFCRGTQAFIDQIYAAAQKG
ncbi:MAG TPA: oxidoreductase [Citreicella sp.]|nr:oxidoreductase [Citreicella sp.]